MKHNRTNLQKCIEFVKLLANESQVTGHLFNCLHGFLQFCRRFLNISSQNLYSSKTLSYSYEFFMLSAFLVPKSNNCQLCKAAGKFRITLFAIYCNEFSL